MPIAPNLHRSLCLALMWLLLGAASPGAAQNANTLLRDGNKHFAAGEYDEAFKLFEAANKVSPQAVFLRSMAFSQLKLFQHGRARELLTEYLAKYPRTQDHAKIKEMVESLEVVVQTTLKIDSDPKGATIYIDAEAAGKVGTTPASVTMQPGKHFVILKADGYRITAKDIAISPKQAHTVDIKLEVPVNATSDPAGAEVFVGSTESKSLGKTPVEIGLPRGTHKIFFRHPGYRLFSANVAVTPASAGQPSLTVNATLRLGIQVATTPAGAKVMIDGKAVEGVTPMDLPATRGTHSIEVALPGYRTVAKNVKVEPGQPAELKLDLVGSSLLTMRTDVPGATVMVEGKAVGRTPVENLPVPAGRREIRLRHPDRRAWEEAVNIPDNNVVEGKVDLGRPFWPIWIASGVTALGVTLGSIGGIVAYNKTQNEANRFVGDQCTGDCSYSMHHLSTASFITAGVAAAAGLTYYLVWVRPSSKFSVHPAPGGSVGAVANQEQLPAPRKPRTATSTDILASAPR